MGRKLPVHGREKLKGLNLLRSKRLTALASAGSLALGAWGYLHQSGEVTVLDPTIERTTHEDNILRVASMMMEGKTATLAPLLGHMAHTRKWDAILLQEVTKDDTQVLNNDRYFGAWHVTFALGDIKQHLPDGGYGNAILTRQKPRDISKKVLPGSSMIDTAAHAYAGVGEDAIANVVKTIKNQAFSPTISNTKDALQESRVAVAETVTFNFFDRPVDIRFANSHIAGVAENANPAVHDTQYDGLFAFLEDNVSSKRPTIFCGDLNSPQQSYVYSLIDARLRPVPNDEPTTLGGRNIDVCASSNGGNGVLGLSEDLRIVRGLHSDHYAIEATWYPSP